MSKLSCDTPERLATTRPCDEWCGRDECVAWGQVIRCREFNDRATDSPFDLKETIKGICMAGWSQHARR